ncbi:MAG: hypothetical protein HZY73_04930 [Micropruina sp.]|nr:MAG: hypothetical protein HZY73_04930 [Micropruina sp.]
MLSAHRGRSVDQRADPEHGQPVPGVGHPSPSATTPSPSPTTPKAMKIGDTIDLGAVSLQLLEAKHIPKGYRDGPAYGIRIKACNKQPAGSHPPGFTGDPWVIVDAEDGQYERSNSLYDSDPVPQFPGAPGDQAWAMRAGMDRLRDPRHVDEDRAGGVLLGRRPG